MGNNNNKKEHPKYKKKNMNWYIRLKFSSFSFRFVSFLHFSFIPLYYPKLSFPTKYNNKVCLSF